MHFDCDPVCLQDSSAIVCVRVYVRTYIDTRPPCAYQCRMMFVDLIALSPSRLARTLSPEGKAVWLRKTSIELV